MVVSAGTGFETASVASIDAKNFIAITYIAYKKFKK